jgi:predicted amino acid racemase
MLTDKTIERNPAMLEAAITLHQRGDIPAPTHLIDLDAVNQNAAVLAQTARANGLRTYVMTKQDGHNPHITRLALDRGMDAVVAVEAIQAHRINRYRFPLGHVGHLSQVPRHQIARILEMRPEYITVYSVDIARAVSDAAVTLGRVQPVYVTVTNPGDGGTFPDMTGGWTEADCLAGLRPLMDMPGIQLAGLTQHVTLDYGGQDAAALARPTQAFFTTLRAKELLEREFGLSLRFNAAGNANTVTMPMLARYGVTDVEPGAALTGSAKFHAVEDMPEIPAHVLVSEYTHGWAERKLTIGGGYSWVWDVDGTPDKFVGLFGRSLDQAMTNRLTFNRPGLVDFHGSWSGVADLRYGDTALFCQMAHAFQERCYVAGVSGIQSGRPVVRGLFDNACNMLGPDLNPVGLGDALDSIAQVSADYAADLSRV